MSHWLEAAVEWREHDAPDPLARYGRHVRWACFLGAVLTHREWTATHEGACPPLCLPYKKQVLAEPAKMPKRRKPYPKHRAPVTDGPPLVALVTGSDPYQ